jgi:hypothetical protein
MDTIKLYNCVVRLGGSLLHTVPKQRISGEEVRLLRHLHGDDAIAEIKEIAAVTETLRKDELCDLADRYSSDPTKLDGRKLIEKVFNTVLADFDTWLADKEAAESDRQEQTEELAAMYARAEKTGLAPAVAKRQ